MRTRIVASALTLSLLSPLSFGCERTPAVDTSEPTKTIINPPSVSRLDVSEDALTATLKRGAAAATVRIELGAPIEAAAGQARDPNIDPPRDSRFLLTDRKDQVISMAGDSLREAGSWTKRTNEDPDPVRTNDELAEDLAVAEDAAAVLMRDERVARWYRWQMRQLEQTARSLGH